MLGEIEIYEIQTLVTLLLPRPEHLIFVQSGWLGLDF
jgi:hypothetical protein